MTVFLHVRHLPGAPSLAEALEHYRKTVGEEGGAQARALLYTPTDCVFDWAEDATADLDPATFEARVFGERGELRWLRDPVGAGEGRATVLVDGADPGESFEAVEMVGTIERRYLLWGRGTGSVKGRHSTLGTARIGHRIIPLAGIGKDTYVRLRAREYVAVDDHGNAYVDEERLYGLEPYLSPEDKR